MLNDGRPFVLEIKKKKKVNFLKSELENIQNQIINMFIKQRYRKKNIIAKNSAAVGKILSAQKLIGTLRNLSLKSYGNNVVESILNPIWTSNVN